VADFRDPWSLRLPEGSTVRRRAVALERRLAAEASRVVTVSPSWGRLFGQRWGRPVDVVPNGHELDLDQLAARSAPDELVVGYLGTYYPATQDLTGVWAALATLESSARVRVIGAANRVLGQQLDAVGLGDRLDVSGFVGQGRVLEELGRCSVLVLAGPTDADPVSRGVVAGKVWEYLATGLPILYVGDETCDIAALLAEQPGCALHASQDVEGIAESLRALRGQTYARNTDNISRRARSGQLAGILEHAVS
jgi:hypothetical protein